MFVDVWLCVKDGVVLGHSYHAGGEVFIYHHVGLNHDAVKMIDSLSTL